MPYKNWTDYTTGTVFVNAVFQARTSQDAPYEIYKCLDGTIGFTEEQGWYPLKNETYDIKVGTNSTNLEVGLHEWFLSFKPYIDATGTGSGNWNVRYGTLTFLKLDDEIQTEIYDSRSTLPYKLKSIGAEFLNSEVTGTGHQYYQLDSTSFGKMVEYGSRYYFYDWEYYWGIGVQAYRKSFNNYDNNAWSPEGQKNLMCGIHIQVRYTGKAEYGTAGVSGSFVLPGDFLCASQCILDRNLENYDLIASGLYSIFNPKPASFFPELDVEPSEPEGGGGDGSQGGGGSYDDTSDKVPPPTTPQFNLINQGLVTQYIVLDSLLPSLAEGLFNDSLWEIMKTLSEGSVFDYILDISRVPYIPTSGEVRPVKIAGKRSLTDNNGDVISLPVNNNQYIPFSFGSLRLEEYFGNFLDYSPYTSVSVYLPGIGHVELDVDVAMGCLLSVDYLVDSFSGSCVATIRVTNTNSNLDSVVYQNECNIHTQIPLQGLDYAQRVNAILQTVSSTALAGATGGASAMMGASLGSGLNLPQKMAPELKGQKSAGSGFIDLSVDQAYLIINRPVVNQPANFSYLKGYKSNIYSSLENLSGFTSLSSVELTNINCTSEELEDIRNKLIEGVML